MYVCICARVREGDVRTAIRCGARTEEKVGDACGAGTGCGTCLDRICDLIDEESGADTLLVPAA
jgi:bacterioferritin-associated ferredoxin